MADPREGQPSPHWVGAGGLSRERAAVLGAKAVLFLHQIDILREVHGKRELWGRQVVAGFEAWASTSVRQWVEEDRDLLSVWRIFKRSEAPGDGFVLWLETLLPDA